jgi:short-subunit dehydrogenase
MPDDSLHLGEAMQINGSVALVRGANMCRAFAPVLAASGGGAIVNMLPITSFDNNPLDATYGAAKAAAWSLTNGVRLELPTLSAAWIQWLWRPAG